MVKKEIVKIGKYKRKIRGRTITVKAHKRRKRKLGKKISYKDVGRFQVAHDEIGNFRGSRIIKIKKKSGKKPKNIKRSRIRVYKNTRELDSDYFDGAIGYDQWINARRRLLNIK